MQRPILLALLLAAAPAFAQAPDAPASVEGPRRLSGPRVGVTYLSPGAVERLNEAFGEYDPETGRETELVNPDFPVVTQFGWQFERRLFQSDAGLTGVTEVVPLLSGLERGLLLPSISFLVGVRTLAGLEIGLGPNLSASGAAYAVAAGFSEDLGGVTVPVHVAAAFGRGGPRLSLLVGLTVSSGRY